MTVSSTSWYGFQADKIEERLSDSLTYFLAGADPLWSGLFVTSQGVGAVDDLGKDHKILRPMQSGYAGVIEPGGPSDDFVLYGDDNITDLGTMFTESPTTTFPDAFNSPNAATYRLGVPMRSMLTNLPLSLHEFQADAHSAVVGDTVATKMVAFARNKAHTMCNYWYLSQNDYYSLGSTVSPSLTTIGGTSNDSVKFELSSEATQRLYNGMRVQLYDSTGTNLKYDNGNTSTGNSTFIVTSVDYMQNSVTITNSDGTAVSLGAGTNNVLSAGGDIVVFAGSKGNANTPFASSPFFTGIAGVNSWLKYDSNDPYLLGAERDTNNQVDVTVRTEHRSFFKNLQNAPLTEQSLRRFLRRFHAAKQPFGQEIDCLVASDGVWLEYEKQRMSREYVDRTGRLASLTSQGLDNGSPTDGGFRFTMDGRTYSGYTSQFIEDGTLYGVKKGGNNWKLYVPPDPARAQRDSRDSPGVPFRFAFPIISQTNNIFAPVYRTSSGDAGATNLVTEYSQAPGFIRCQLVPDQPAGMKLTNIKTDKVFSD